MTTVAPPKSKAAVPAPPCFKSSRHRVPTVLQMEAVECGAACLAMVLASYGRWVPLEELRETCNVSRDGADAANVIKAGRRYGLTSKGMRSEIADLGGLRLPAIIYWNFRHFVVLEGATRKGAWINDPAGGPRLVPWEEFDLSFTGISLIFEPGPDFERYGQAPSLRRALSARLRGARGALALCLVAGIGLILPGLVLPVILRIFVDRVLTAGGGANDADRGTVGVLVLALFLAAGVSMVLSWLQQLTLVRLSTKLAISMSARFFQHLLKLPIVFFQQRFAGTLVTRTNVNDQVAMLLSSQFASALLQSLTVLFYAGLMFVYSAELAAVTVALNAVNLVVLRWVARRRTDANRRLVLDSAKLTSTAMGGLQNIETLKAIGEEGGLFSRWAGQQAKVANARRELGRPTVLIDALPGWLITVNTIFIVGFGSWRVLDGSLSLGTLAAFQVLAANFSAPIGQLVGLGSTVQEMTGKIASVDDVLDYAEDDELGGARIATTGEDAISTDDGASSQGSGRVGTHRDGRTGKHRADAWPGLTDGSDIEPVLLPARVAAGGVAVLTAREGRLSGLVELRDVSFGYDHGKDPLIEGFSLTVEPGQRVAIIGSSGSGKSTVARLVCGLNQPWSGQILLDGVPRQQIEARVLASSLAFVDQEIVLFEAPVRDNLTLWDPTIGAARVAAAARDAEIYRDVIARPGGFDRVVEEAGRDWSGGQRQRLEIARALATNPSVVVLDEATSALDALVEARIDRHLRARGCTCIIVAHRLSTIRDADEIVVMEGGRAVERGTHEELIKNGTVYTRLVHE